MSEKKSGWYTNEKGEICYDGQCFSIVSDPDKGKFDVEFDDPNECRIDEVSQAERAFLGSVLNGQGVGMRRRGRKGKRRG